MHAVVLAGGYATRLWPLTRNRPKMLLPVGETTIIDRVLDALESDDRISNVYLSTNERFADDFRAHLADSSFEKPQLSVEETTDEDEKLGVVGALDQLVHREDIAEEDLIVVAGDNLISFDLSAFIDRFEATGDPTLAAYDIDSREDASAYGIVDVEDGCVVDFEEKPSEPSSTLVSLACYAFPADAPTFGDYLAGDNNPDEPGWFIQWLVNRTTVQAFTFDGEWYDVGTPESYLEAVAWALDGDSIVADSAVVEDSTVGPNVHLMPGAEVSDSTIEHSVVFDDATIEACDIRESIVDRETHVQNLDLAGALIGAHTEIKNGSSP
ncbi:MAG: sugar phosphate nucleotidyltransferase [Halococcoides sp.]